MSQVAQRLTLAAMLLMGMAAAAQETWADPGPSSTRDMFPLNMFALTYHPIGATTLDRGQGLVSLQIARANTFEFSNLIKNHLSQDAQGRTNVDLAGATAFAAANPKEPLIFFFDCEIQRSELQFKYGATASTELGVTFAWQGISGGYLDGPIEAFHKLGFEQTGRSGIVKNQVALVVIQKGHVVLFNQETVLAHPMDPVLTVLHRLYEGPALTLSLVGILQLPLTRWSSLYQSNWNTSAGLVWQVRPSDSQVFDGGVAYLRRALKHYGPDPFFIKDQVAGHLGWEYRGWRGLRPYLILLGTSGITTPEPGATLDKPSLLHDLGVHVRLGSAMALTLSYINNISHNENTADMAIALRLSVRP